MYEVPRKKPQQQYLSETLWLAQISGLTHQIGKLKNHQSIQQVCHPFYTSSLEIIQCPRGLNGYQQITFFLIELNHSVHWGTIGSHSKVGKSEDVGNNDGIFILSA